ncbi:Pentatricopeptide repeat [Trema orientale]|uniref:Pentatricopeptide repeat n=1 Tax=Trema orientale TaxID=63057 RepID=A0A2P5E2V2_TREOI|nr:Pentatricopeptide repeat [Trema orientale]
MSVYRLLLRSLRRPCSTSQTLTPTLLLHNSQTNPHPDLTHTSPSSPHFLPTRSFAFSSAEEAAAERRRRKRRLRIEPPLHALRRDPHPPAPRDPNAPRLPDSTSALVGPRLNLHNRVQSLIRAGDLDAASAIARHSVFSNTRPTVFTCNAIIAAMYRAKRYSDAIALFQFFFNQSNIVPNIVSYNNLINTHCDEGRVDVGLEVYRHIIANAPFSPSPVTFRHLTKGLIDAGRIGEAVDLLREMLNKGHGADSLVFNNLISGFLNLENLEKANELFDELKERCLVYDGVVNATFMDWFFNRGREKEAMESYKSLLDKQFRMIPATCNVLLEVLLKHGKKTEAWALFDQMLDNHTPPNFQAVNSETFNIMVNECFKLGKVDEAIATFRKVGTKVNSKPFAMDVAGYNNIITRYCENGMLSEAETLFTELCSKSLSPDVNTHRTLIDAHLKVERIDDALTTFNRMVEAGLRVVASFGNRVFEELIKNGKAVDCAQILKKMGEKDPKPDVSCYEVVIKGLCNEGSYDPSRELLEEMIRYGIGVTPALKQFVNEAFAKVGREEEIERVLSMNRLGYAPASRMTAPRQQPFLRAQMTEPGQMSAQGNSSIGHSQRNGFHHPPSGPAQMAGPYQRAPGSPQMAAPQHIHSVSPQMGSQQPPSGPPQMGSPYYPPSQSPQMGGLHYPPSGAPQMAGPQYPPAVTPPQMAGHHQNLSRTPQVAGPQYPSSASSQMGGPQHHPSGPPSQMAGFQQHHPPGPPQMAGAYHHQMSQSSQMAGWNMGAPQYPPSGPSQMARPYDQRLDSNQMSDQQQFQSESHQPQVADQIAAA